MQIIAQVIPTLDLLFSDFLQEITSDTYIIKIIIIIIIISLSTKCVNNILERHKIPVVRNCALDSSRIFFYSKQLSDLHKFSFLKKSFSILFSPGLSRLRHCYLLSIKFINIILENIFYINYI